MKTQKGNRPNNYQCGVGGRGGEEVASYIETHTQTSITTKKGKIRSYNTQGIDGGG